MIKINCCRSYSTDKHDGLVKMSSRALIHTVVLEVQIEKRRLTPNAKQKLGRSTSQADRHQEQCNH